MSTEEDPPPKYNEGYLMKKEDDKKWQEYWVVLRGIYLIFYIHKSPLGEIIDQFCGCIKLNRTAKCVPAKRKGYSFPFYLVTDKAKYLFKTGSNINRHQWFNTIELAAQGKPPSNQLGFLPTTNNNIENNDIDTQLLGETNDGESQNPNVKNEKEELNEDEFDFNENEANPCKVINIEEVQPGCMTSRFLERSFDNASFENDLIITEMENQIKNPDKLVARYREIYCNEDTAEETREENMPNDKEKGESDKNAVPCSGYPQLSKHTKYLYVESHERITRLTKSAESLKGIPLVNSSRLSIEGSSPASSYSNSSMHVQRPLNNGFFSRHLVSSAPEVKSITGRQSTPK